MSAMPLYIRTPANLAADRVHAIACRIKGENNGIVDRGLEVKLASINELEDAIRELVETYQ